MNYHLIRLQKQICQNLRSKLSKLFSESSTITDLNKRTMASNRTTLCKTVTMLNKKEEKMK